MKKVRNKEVTRREFMKTMGKAAAVATVAGTGVASFAPPAVAKKKDRIIFGMTQEPVQFNPILYVNRGTENVPEGCMFDALWDINEKGVFVPNLATQVPSLENGGISADGKIWKIPLKKGVKWTDGAPFTAKDVEFTYQTIMNPKVAVRSRTGFDLIKNFKVVDDYNVEIELNKPFTPFLWAWQEMHIIPHHILSTEKDINTSTYNSQPIGTGPFMLKSRVAGSHMIYTRNPDYHRGPAKVETFVHKFVPDQMVLYTQAKTGEVDYMGLAGVPFDRWEEAKEIKDRDFFSLRMPWVQFIYFNCEKPQFKDPRVRKALYLACEMQKSIDDIYYGHRPRTLSYLHTTHWAYNHNLKEETPDPERAVKLLEEAGWKVGSDGVREKDGVKLKFTNSTTSGQPDRQGCQALFQQNWKAINVEMEIKNFPASVVWGEYTTKSQFDTLLVAWAPIVGLDPDYTARCHSKMIPNKYGVGSNYVQYANLEVDALLEKGVTVSDMEERKKIYWKLQEILLEEVPFAPQGGSMRGGMKKQGLEGIKPNQYVTDEAWNVQEWYWS